MRQIHFKIIYLKYGLYTAHSMNYSFLLKATLSIEHFSPKKNQNNNLLFTVNNCICDIII